MSPAPTTLPEPPLTGRELKTRIDLGRVVDLTETRDVRPINRDHVERLAIAVDGLPPIDVVKLVEGKFGILAGYHRREAHRLAGVKTIRVVVWDLDPEGWFAFAVRSNLSHGLPLTMAERRVAARRMLLDGDRRSDRAIAADCGISDKTVAKLREAENDEGTTAEYPQLRVGLDGKARRPPRRPSAATLDKLRSLLEDHAGEPDSLTDEGERLLARALALVTKETEELKAVPGVLLEEPASGAEWGSDEADYIPEEPEWTPEELDLRRRCEGGEAVVANQHRHGALIGWAKESERYERIDRSGDWGNPFVVGPDGERAEVIGKYAHFLLDKTSLFVRLGELRGHVLGCWCAPEPCHGDLLAELAGDEVKQRVYVWADKVRTGLRTLVRMAGYPVPDGIADKLDEPELALLGTVLDAITQRDDLEQLRHHVEQRVEP